MRIRHSNLSKTDPSYSAGICFKYVNTDNTNAVGASNYHIMLASDLDDCNMLVVSTSHDDTYQGETDAAMQLRILGHKKFTDKYILTHSIGVAQNSMPHTQDFDTLYQAQSLGDENLRSSKDFTEIWAGPNGEGENVIVLSKRVTAASGGGRGSDERFKENIKQIGMHKGFNIYEYNYLWSPKKLIGVIAQEVEKIMPEAVFKINGYRFVDYGMIV